jgi:DNA polymerase-1
VQKIRTDQLTVERLAGLTALERESVYNALDVCVTHEVLAAMLPQLDPVSRGTYDFSRALQGPVLEMTIRGLRVDIERRDQLLQTINEDIERLSEALDEILHEGIGTDVSWRSPQQLMKLFYDVLNIPPVRKRGADGMRMTVNREAIERLSMYFLAEPICLYLLALRDLDKKRQLLETGIDRDGRMRTNFNIAGTTTGRLASAISDFGTGTNLQNLDRELRSIFIADAGYKLANLDLEQADARNVGAICWNSFVETHGEAFAGSYLDACEGGDLHTTVCRMAWQDLPWTADLRRVADSIAYRSLSYRDLAKKLGHGTNYYGSPPTMARHTKVDRKTIEDFQHRYFTAFPCIGSTNRSDHLTSNWHNSVRQHLKTAGYLTTLLGRRRYFFGRWNDDETLRAAIAYEPQSLTADEIDQGLLNLFRADRVDLLLQVHDSILIQFPEEREDDIVPWALAALRVHIPLAKERDFVVPVEAKCGWNWGDANDKNPDGLIKWGGSDSRKRSESPSTTSPSLNLVKLVG